MIENKKILEVGFEAAKKSGEFLMSKYGKIKKISSKERKDILTEVDLGSEKIILDIIKNKFSNHNILSEEIGEIKNSDSEYLWIIDPLDATVNYTAGLPLFSVSIGLVKNKIPFFGIVYAPYLNELFYAIKGQKAFLNNSKIAVSKNKNLSESVINIGLSAHYNDDQIKKTWSICNKITPKLRGIRAFESGALTSAYVACGRLDGKISIKTDPFGNAASTIIIEEAGGKVTDSDNRSWSTEMIDMICSNGIIHQDILDNY